MIWLPESRLMEFLVVPLTGLQMNSLESFEIIEDTKQ
jgi:hypothetical protein